MMNAIIDPISLESVAAALVKEHTSASIITTLYDLMAVIQDVVDTNDTLVVATVRHILGSGGATWRGNVAPCTS
jgi:hypothetical protein